MMNYTVLLFAAFVAIIAAVQIVYDKRTKKGTQPWPSKRKPVSAPASAPVEISSADRNAPLSVLQYFLYQLLFAVPIVGFVFLIIFSIDSSNINRRNFARSIWCIYALIIVIGLIAALMFKQAISMLFGF